MKSKSIKASTSVKIAFSLLAVLILFTIFFIPKIFGMTSTSEVPNMNSSEIESNLIQEPEQIVTPKAEKIVHSGGSTGYDIAVNDLNNPPVNPNK